MQSKMKNISRNVLTHADIKNPPNNFTIGGFFYLSTEINAKSNGGEAGIRTLGPSYPGQLLSRQLQSATLPPLHHNFNCCAGFPTDPPAMDGGPSVGGTFGNDND